jgi:hypothetical protein
MTRQQRGKRLVGVPIDVLPQQIPVSRFLHLLINVRRGEKVPIYFLERGRFRRRLSGWAGQPQHYPAPREITAVKPNAQLESGYSVTKPSPN